LKYIAALFFLLTPFSFQTSFVTFAVRYYFKYMRIVDTKGQVCPAPLIEAKKALKETNPGESFILITDNKTTFDNLSRFLKDNKAGFKVSESGGVWTLTITRSDSDLIQTRPEEYCTPEIPHIQKGNYIVVISSDKMGEGNEQLGHLLIINFVKALKDLDKLPQKIIFYNNGVKLATKSSPVIDHLKDLENMGVEILLCATCVNFYCLETVVGVGAVSNMYTIAEAMAASEKVIKP
jgi:selenium metabolism protein YedF